MLGTFALDGRDYWLVVSRWSGGCVRDRLGGLNSVADGYLLDWLLRAVGHEHSRAGDEAVSFAITVVNRGFRIWFLLDWWRRRSGRSSGWCELAVSGTWIYAVPG